jgi:hypothetical protein
MILTNPLLPTLINRSEATEVYAVDDNNKLVPDTVVMVSEVTVTGPVELTTVPVFDDTATLV